VVEADRVIAALGFDTLSCPRYGKLGKIAVNDCGGIIVDANHMTSVPGIFASGDLVHGPSPLLHAVRDARRAARQIDSYISQSGK
jgi:glutamate synthase (NADPH/NADH) small chain